MSFHARPEDYPPGSPIRRQLEAAAKETDRILARQAAAAARTEPAPTVVPPPPMIKAPEVNEGEEEFALQLRAHKIPFEREYVFHQSRRWRFDFALVEHLIAIEIEGAIWKKGGGGHSHPSGIESDIEKYNAAAMLGWRVLRFQPDKHVRTGTGIAMVAELLEATP